MVTGLPLVLNASAPIAASRMWSAPGLLNLAAFPSAADGDECSSPVAPMCNLTHNDATLVWSGVDSTCCDAAHSIFPIMTDVTAQAFCAACSNTTNVAVRLVLSTLRGMGECINMTQAVAI